MDLTNVECTSELERHISELPITLYLSEGTRLSIEKEDGTIYIEPQNGYVLNVKLGEGTTVEASDENTLLISYKDQAYAFSYRPPQKPF